MVHGSSCPFFAQICHRGHPVKCHIFNPFRHLLHGSASKISVNVGFTSKLTAKFKELMRSETVVLYHTTPMGINHFLPVLFRSDSVFPVILVRKTSPRPAQYRNLNLFECFHHICTHPIDIRDFRVFTHIESFIDASAQMFREMPVDLRCNGTFFLFC